MKYSLFILMFLASIDGMAHPVSFQDSVGIMGHHGPKASHFQLNYSWKHWLATGLHHFSLIPQGKLKNANLASVNFLIKRWNGSNYQSNIYGALGAGVSDLTGKSEGIGMGLFQFDIEDRDYYFMTKYIELLSDDQSHLRQATARVGVSPYVGSYTDIHTWLILEWQRNEFLESHLDVDITPYVRVFYKNILFEIGHSFDGATRFNYITHF